MPLVKDPNSLTYEVTVGGSSLVVTPDVRAKYNDLFHGWHELTAQLGRVMSKRLDRATYYRARFKTAVKV